jgi:hypothetical protein
VRYTPVGATVALTICLGCVTVQPVEQPDRFFERASPREVYVTFKNHSKVTIIGPRLSGDTLIGLVAGVSHPLAAPLSHVERIEALQRDRGRTRWLIAGVGLATAGLVFGIMQSGSNDWRHPCERLGATECDWNVYRIAN